MWGKWFPVANIDIWNHQNKHDPTPEGSRPYFDSSTLHMVRQWLLLWNKAKLIIISDAVYTTNPRQWTAASFHLRHIGTDFK